MMDREEARKKALEQTREQVEEVDRIQLLMKAVKSLDTVRKSQEQQIEVFRDWYSLHFPELEREIKDDDQLTRILSKNVSRTELDAFSELAEASTGVHLEEDDLEVLETFVENLSEQGQLEEELEEYVRKIAMEEMPNVSILLDPVLAARIVRLAGGLEELAKKPASTVQMLGAEKALFRHLREGDNPPKHGVLFHHEYVKKTEERGKMARFLANKTVIAARLDSYGDKEKGEELREEARQKFEELD